MMQLYLLVSFALLASSVCRGSDADVAAPVIDTETPTALIWKCTKPDGDTLHELISNGHRLSLEVISTHKHTVHVLSSNHDSKSLQSVGLSSCTPLTSLKDLFQDELIQNWHKLQGNAGEWIQESISNTLEEQPPRYAKRSVDDNKECVLSGKCDGLKDEWFTEYHNFTETYSWFEELATAHPSYVTLNRSIGKTHRHRDIMAVHITDKSKPAEKKLRVYFQCLLHARKMILRNRREWISGPVCMYIARYFANPPSDEIVLLLSKIEFIIVPVANPDGYHLTWVQYPKYRFWRKNTVSTNNPDCDGVDLNRNFDAHWSLEGSSDDPCSGVYHGESAGSELEVQAITQYILSNAPVLASIDFHSYYQEILFPPAWGNHDSSNVKSLEYVSQKMASEASKSGKKYTAHSMHSIYLAAGTFPDWMLEHGVDKKETDHCSPLSFTVELRPQDTEDIGYTGFMVPTEQIIPTCEEMMSTVVTFSHLVIDQFSSCV